LPSELDYVEGEDLDTTGLCLEVQYADGTKEIVEEGFFLNGENLQETEITVFYEGKTARFSLSLSPKPNYVFSAVGVALLLACGVGAFLYYRKEKKASSIKQ
jgi:hypothetical protein